MDFHYVHSTVFEYWIAIPTPLDGSRSFKISRIKRTEQSSSQQTKKTLLFLEMWRILKNWCTPLLNLEEVLSTIEDFFLPFNVTLFMPYAQSDYAMDARVSRRGQKVFFNCCWLGKNQLLLRQPFCGWKQYLGLRFFFLVTLFLQSWNWVPADIAIICWRLFHHPYLIIYGNDFTNEISEVWDNMCFDGFIIRVQFLFCRL